MHAQPQRTLKRLLKQYGQELIDDPRRTEALLRDLCGQHTREIFVLVNAQKQRIPSELRAAPAWMPRQATYSRLSRLLQTKLALTEDAADWAVSAWASALELDTTTKDKGWSWLPTPLRTPPPSTSRKSRKKKRQNSPSGVQYGKGNSRQSASRRARNRGERAERGSRFPGFYFAWPDFLWKLPYTWTKLRPWVGLLAATIFLLAVAYWTAGDRSLSLIATDVPERETPEAGSAVGSEAEIATSVGDDPTDELPELTAAPAEYLGALITLPTWANVNVTDAPLRVRAEPSTNTGFVSLLYDHTPVRVIAFSDDGEWSQIDSPNSGWVSNEFILFESQDAPTSVQLDVQLRRTKSYSVGVRTAPSSTADVTEMLSPGVPVVVVAMTADSGTWYQIADPASGWVAGADLAPESP